MSGKTFYQRGDWSKAAFFAKNDLGDLRSKLSDKYYKGNDEVLGANLTYSAIAPQEASDNLHQLRVADDTDTYYWNEYQTMSIAKWDVWYVSFT